MLQEALRNFYSVAEATINTPGPAPNPYKDYPRLMDVRVGTFGQGFRQPPSPMGAVGGSSTPVRPSISFHLCWALCVSHVIHASI